MTFTTRLQRGAATILALGPLVAIGCGVDAWGPPSSDGSPAASASGSTGGSPAGPAGARTFASAADMAAYAASIDLACPSVALASSFQNGDATKPVAGEWFAIGCDQLAVYDCTLGVGCHQQTYESQVSARASSDLACPAASVAIAGLAETETPQGRGTYYAWYYRATGCGAASDYACTGDYGGLDKDSCVRASFEDAPQHVPTDLACPAPSVTTTPVAESLTCVGGICADFWRIGATGCGRAALYACAYGCAPTVRGGVLVDGGLFSPTACASGDAEHEGFFGADLSDASGAKLRVVEGVTGDAAIVLFPAGGGAPVTMPDGCAIVVLAPEADGGVSGTAKLDCASGGHTITGSVLLDACAS